MMTSLSRIFLFFFFNDTATTEIYTLSLHDALPILGAGSRSLCISRSRRAREYSWSRSTRKTCSQVANDSRSEEHTSELQSQSNLVCRLLLEKKKKKKCSRTYCQTTDVVSDAHKSYY